MKLPEFTTAPPAVEPTLTTGGAVPLLVQDPVTPAQRAADFSAVFAWHGQEVKITVASELYYRELRTHMSAPALGDVVCDADFGPDDARVLYTAWLSLQEIMALRLLQPVLQVKHHLEWVNEHITTLRDLDEARALVSRMREAVDRARSEPITAGGQQIDGVGN